MNKFLFTIIGISAITSCSLSANAQHSLSSRKHASSTCRYAHSAAKTTADQARVIAGAYLEYDGTGYAVVDSSVVKYSNGRGSTYNQNNLTANFDSVFTYKNTGSTFAIDSRSWQTFDSHNNVLSSTQQNWTSWISNWRNSYNDLSTYDAANNLLTYTNQEWDTTTSAWVSYFRETNTYTTANKKATTLSEMWNSSSSAWENSYRTSNAYDASNFLISSASEMWNASTATWDSTNKSVYTTDASGNILTETTQYWNSTSGSWENVNKNIYSSYTGSSAGSIVSQGWNPSTSAFVNSHRDNYVFNSYNQPTFTYDETWNVTSGNWERTASNNYGERFYYQVYGTAATPNIVSNSGKATIYPVPAKDVISVNVTWNEPQAFTIVISDMAGRVISTSSITECGSYTGTIPVNDLASGNYLIKMEGANGRLVQRFVIEK